jgi:hypothetical protein
MSTKYSAISLSLKNILTILLTAALMFSLPLVANADSNPVLAGTTSWGFPYAACIRGLAYDGHYYYIASCSDASIDGRPEDLTGRIYVYDDNGFVKRFPENPPIRNSYFTHGVATDGIKLWTTDYWSGHIYEYEIASGNLLRTFNSPVANPVRLDFDSSTQTLWLTGYGNPKIYQVDLNGHIVSSFATTGYTANNKAVALDGKGGLWVSGISAEGGGSLLRRYTFSGQLVEEFPGFTTGFWAMATNINNRTAGFIQDAAPALNSVTGRMEQKIEHFVVPSNCDVGVNAKVTASGFIYSRSTKTYHSTVYVKNTGTQYVNGPVSVVFINLPTGVTLLNPSGTSLGSPYKVIPSLSAAPDVFAPNQTVSFPVQFNATVPINFSTTVCSGSLAP